MSTKGDRRMISTARIDNHPGTICDSLSKVNEKIASISKYEEDGWCYKAIEVAPGRYKIAIYDEDGEFIGYSNF